VKDSLLLIFPGKLKLKYSRSDNAFISVGFTLSYAISTCARKVIITATLREQLASSTVVFECGFYCSSPFCVVFVVLFAFVSSCLVPSF
jgi:hypothetical protein